MKKMPWVRFFASDWLAGTRGMSAAETGVYITLIATMYERQEPIPEDHARLARLCGASNSAFKKALDILIDDEKIIRTDAGLWNERVQKERVYLSEKSEVGLQAANARWGKKDNENNDEIMQTQCGRNANAMPFQKPDIKIENNSNELSKKKDKNGTRLPADFYPDREWSAQQGFSNSELRDQFARFQDYWNSLSGAKAVKKDWQATWRNWIRSAKDRKRPQHQPTTVSGLAAQMVRERFENENNRRELEQPSLLIEHDPERFDINEFITGSKKS